MGRPLCSAKPTRRRNRESCREESTASFDSCANVRARRSPGAGRAARPWAAILPRTATPGSSPTTTLITWPTSTAWNSPVSWTNARSRRASYAGPTPTRICPRARPSSPWRTRRLPCPSARVCTRSRTAASTRSASRHARRTWCDSTTRDGRWTPSPSTRASSTDAYASAWPTPRRAAEILNVCSRGPLNSGSVLSSIDF